MWAPRREQRDELASPHGLTPKADDHKIIYQVGAVHRSKSGPLMSALGQKRKAQSEQMLSASPPKADIERHDRHVRFTPKAAVTPAILRIARSAASRLQE
jgi:hypothetical protein